MEGNEPPDPPVSPDIDHNYSITPVTFPTSSTPGENPTGKKRTSDMTNNNVPSKQSKSLPIRLRYSNLDKPPYLVHVSRIQSDPTANITLHPVKFGQFLKIQHFPGILNNGLKRVGRNRVSVEFSNPADANSFITHPLIMQNGYSTSIPTYNITRMGVVREIPVDWSPEEISTNLEVPTGCGQIIKARRINRKVITNGSPEWQPTQSVILTFDGQTLPKRVFCCYNSLPVELYKYPTIQCFNCCRFGHTKLQCRSKPRCYKCSQNHTGEGCPAPEDTSVCLYCSGRHFAISKCCPEYVRQTEIKTIMAERYISYEEASKSQPPSYRSFADISKTTFSPLLNSANTSQPIYPQSTTTSYKKTFITPRKPRLTQLPGYDKQAHQDILNEFNIPPATNGCALPNLDHSDSSYTISNLILTLLANILNNKNSTLSNHVATKLNSILQHHNEFTQVSSVEHQKYPE